MALVHESLYHSENMAAIDFADYARALAANLFRSYNLPLSSVSLTTALESVALSIDTAVPCGLILNELVANCLKHAFPEGREGTIHLALKVTDQSHCVLQVLDNGIGMPPDLEVR